MPVYLQKKYIYSVLVFGICLIFYLFIFNLPIEQRSNVYETFQKPDPVFNSVHFEEVSQKMGLKFKAELSDETWPSTSIIDINSDGWPDIYITRGSNSENNKLYINHSGKYFTEESAAYGIGNVNSDAASSYALWGDFNDDGRVDLLLAKWGCHKLFYGQPHTQLFSDQTALLNGYCSHPEGVNTADFFHSGRLDFVFGNFTENRKIDNNEALWMQSVRYDDRTGGANHLLVNTGKDFKINSASDFLFRSYTHSVGISDINSDGWPDLFFANDYGYDSLFINQKNGQFTNETNNKIPLQKHGLSGMNAEFFDVFNTGNMDLYVTNIYKPPIFHTHNLLWKKNDNLTYDEISIESGIAKCGFSWGGKFADFNNDGEPDLYVVNGRNRGQKNSKIKKSLWFERVEIAQIPQFLKKLYTGNTLVERQISANERKCLFMQKNKHFIDIAEYAGVADTDERRGLSLIDFNNDGKMDLLSTGPQSEIKLYQNTSSNDKNHHWIGFSFKNKYGSSIPHGLTAYLILNNGKRLMREFYPANGYRGTSDPRLHFGLGSQTPKEIEILWPGQFKFQKYTDFKIDTYNLIIEKTHAD